MASFFNQYILLLLILCKLKGLKFLLMALLIACAFSNHFIYGIVRLAISSIQIENFQTVAPGDVAKRTVILGNWDHFQQEKSIIEHYYSAGGLNKIGVTFNNCRRDDDCKQAFFSALVGRMSEKFTSLVNFPDNGKSPAELLCQTRRGHELHCALLGSLLLMTQISQRLRRFGTVKMFQAIVDAQRELDLPEPATLCAKHPDFRTVMPYTITVQVILLLFSFCFYALVSTVACVCQLKDRGFLQMLFQRGLSVQAYWLTLWTVTIAELAIVSAALIVSYHSQCPAFYSASRLSAVFFAAIIHMACLASGILLLTILIRDSFQIGLVAVILTLLCVSVAVMLRTSQGLLKGKLKIIRHLSIVLAPGHMAERLQEALLKHVEYGDSNSYQDGWSAVSYCLLAFIIILTLYLDYVLPHGNGFRLPLLYLFMMGFWVRNRGVKVPTAGQEKSNYSKMETESEFQIPIVRLRNLVKRCSSRGDKNNWTSAIVESVTLYQDCIAAIVGHGKSGKTTIGNILSAIDSPDCGFVSINDCDISSSAARIHMKSFIGHCQQKNCLSHGLTVNDSIRLLLVSCKHTNCEVELDKFLEAFNLAEKRTATVGSMSSSERRLLCFVLALLGEPKLLVLDEPTRGLDPYMRRRIWNFLQEFKTDRCIIFITKHIDEAELLADRVLFTANGKVVCGGSVPFLQKLFTCGYKFNIELKIERLARAIMHDLRGRLKHIRSSSVCKSNIKLELSSMDSKLLSTVTAELERLSDHIQSMSLTSTSLREMFSKLRNRSSDEIATMLDPDPVQTESDASTTEKMSVLSGASRKQSVAGTVLSSTCSDPPPWPWVDSFATLMFVRLLRNRPKIARRLGAAAVLLTLLIALAAMERMAKNDELQVHQLIGNASLAALDFADCLTDADAFNSASSAFHGDSQTGNCFHPQSPTRKLNSMSKLSWQSFRAHYLSNPDMYKALLSYCKEASGCTSPYQIAYVSNTCTCPVEFNQIREVYTGSVIDYRHYSSHLMAEKALETFRHVLKYYAANFVKNGSNQGLMVNVVYDFRSMTIPTFGAFFQLLLIASMPAMLIEDIAEESKLRRILAIMGLSRVPYWLSIFLLHWTQCATVYVLSVAVLVSIISSGYLSLHYLVGIVLPTLLLGISSNQLLVHLISRLFDGSAAQVAASYYLVCSFSVLSLLAAQLSNRAGLALLFLLPPVASMSPTFYGSKLIFYALSYHRARTMSGVPDGAGLYFGQTHLMYSVLAMLIHCALLCAVLVLTERHRKQSNALREQSRCDDSISRVQSVQEFIVRDDALLHVRHLRVTFSNGSAEAVKDLAFSTAAGEILGFVGPNGSGKSTILEALAGGLAGAECSGESLLRQPGEDWRECSCADPEGCVGFWPRWGPLFPQITALEHLAFFARCRMPHMHRSQLALHVGELLRLVDLEFACNTRVACLSSESTRLLCLAVAMLGNPTLLLLDGCASDGLDQQSRKAVQSAVRSWLAEKPDSRTVVLSSRSADEAEELCNSVGILNDGLLVHLDSTESFKQLHELHYFIDVQIDARRCLGNKKFDSELKEKLGKTPLKKYANSSLIESLPHRVTFVAKIDQPVWSAIRWLCQLHESAVIKLFTLRPMTLDRVYRQLIRTRLQRLKTSDLLADHSDDEDQTDEGVRDAS